MTSTDYCRDSGTKGRRFCSFDQMAVLALPVADRAYVLQGGTVKHSGNGAHDLRYDLDVK